MRKFAEVLRRLGMSPIEARALVNLLRGRAVLVRPTTPIQQESRSR